MTGERGAGATEAEREVAAALGRAAVYRTLGRAFAYPTPDTLGELGRLAEDGARSPLGPAGVGAELGRLAAAAREADPAALADEYTFLFDRQVRCPPYESAYGAVPQMAGKAAELADVAGFYRAFGLAPAAERPDIEDHVAAELEFLSVLALKEAYALAEGEAEGLAVTREAQRRFLTDHLGRWAETFAREIVAATPVPYYVAGADLLAAWVRVEVQALGAAPAPVEGRADPGPLGADRFTCPMAGAPQDAGEADGPDDPAR